MDAREVTRRFRSDLWPSLRAHGFIRRTERVAWRDVGDSVDVIEINLIGPLADAVGCTSYSFGAFVASLPAYLSSDRIRSDANGRHRPHYWECALKMQLFKTLPQPWFQPLASPVRGNLPESSVKHRKGLMAVLRTDVHDRTDTWFVREDGANLSECVVDLLLAIERVGLPLLQRLHDPCAVAEILRDGPLAIRPDSPAGRDLLEAAHQACDELRGSSRLP
jgi:hypothetical protein